jgi:hypothetical protein
MTDIRLSTVWNMEMSKASLIMPFFPFMASLIWYAGNIGAQGSISGMLSISVACIEYLDATAFRMFQCLLPSKNNGAA